jgi:hypothetical protein
MPQPIRLNSRLVWDRLQLDDAFAALSNIAMTVVRVTAVYVAMPTGPKARAHATGKPTPTSHTESSPRLIQANSSATGSAASPAPR